MNLHRLSGLGSNAWNRLTVVSFALGLLSLTACQSAPTHVEARNLASLPRTLTVTGKGDVTIPTTMTQVSLAVLVQGQTSQEVQQQVAQRSSAVVELLKSRKEVEKLETTGISLNPVYSYKDNEQRLTGYSGTNTVSFQIETQKSGPLLDEAIKAGATKINGIRLVASESAIGEAQKQAIKEAAADAKKQADAVLGALNLNQQEVVSVQVNGANPPQPLERAFAMSAPMDAKQMANASTPVVGGDQKVEASVTLQIRY